MKAYCCDECKDYHQGSPAGVLYDNRDPHQGKRYDLCPECLEVAVSQIKIGVIKVADISEIAEED